MNAFINRRMWEIRSHYRTPVLYFRAVGLLQVVGFVALGWLFWVLVTVTRAITGDAPLETDITILLVIIPVALGTIFNLVARGRLDWASWLFSGMLFVISVPLVVNSSDTSSVSILFLPVISATLLQGRWGVVASVVGAGTLLIMGAFVQSRLAVDTTNGILVNLSFLLMVFSLGILYMYAFAGSIQTMIEQSLEEIEQFKTTGRVVAQASQQNEFLLLADVLSGLRNELGYSFAQFFLADDTGQLNRRLRLGVASGEFYTLTEVTIGDVNALTEAARTRQSVLVSAGDPEVRRTHFLPSSNFGVAVPVVLHDRLLGVLDVQTTEQRITPAHIDVLNTLANQMSIRFDDTRTMNSLRHTMSEQQSVNESLRGQLRDVRQVERQQTSLVWDVYLDRRGQQAIGFDLDPQTQSLIPAHDLPEALRPSYHSHELLIEARGDEQIMMVPVILRDEVIGSMAFSIPAGVTISDRQKDVAQSVANRLALALDNRRLFEQSQSQAVRERKANELVNLLIGATDVDAVMSLAASSFNEALGAISTRVYLQADVLSTQSVSSVVDPPAQNGEGSQ